MVTIDWHQVACIAYFVTSSLYGGRDGQAGTARLSWRFIQTSLDATFLKCVGYRKF